MKRKTYSVVLQATLVLVLVAFLSTIFFAYANTSFAATAKKKSQGIARMSAVDYTEAQIKRLQGTLNITEAQKDLWNNLMQVMRENAKDMDALNKERAEKTEPMNAVEHMKFHSEITQAHLNQMNKLIPPFEAFYVSLSYEQKNIVDTTFRTGRYGKSKRK
jgi:peptidoglycan hydrolase CwlO-like protein